MCTFEGTHYSHLYDYSVVEKAPLLFRMHNSPPPPSPPICESCLPMRNIPLPH